MAATRPDPAAMPAAEPNLTPLVDVLLVLLIIFMLINVLELRRHFDLQLPATAGGEPMVAPIVLEVRPGGYALNRAPVPAGELAARLRAAYAARPQKVIFVKGDPRVRYQDVISAVDIARGAGVRVVAVETRD